jgi:predicted oxidoreductase
MNTMRVKLERNGPEVSRIALGMMRLKDWNLSASKMRGRLERCVELGLTTFDHADIYGDGACESLFGAAWSSIPSMRRDIQLITKCGIMRVSGDNGTCTIKHYCTEKSHILASAESSLNRLRTDYLDLLMIHRPDPLMDVDEIAEAFVSLHDSGKVLFFGVSNFTPVQFELLASRLPFPLVTNQIECSVLVTRPFEDGTIDMCMKHRISPMAWSPLGGGYLFHGRSKQALRVRKELKTVGDRLGGITSLGSLALTWLLKHPSRIVPVVGSGRLDRILAAIESTKTDLPREDWFRIWTASQGHDVP